MTFAKSDTTECQCGATDLSKPLFLGILDDQACDGLSSCTINDVTVDANTYNATKAFNCTSECFQFFAAAPVPSESLSSSPLSPKSSLSHTALVAVVIGVVVFVLLTACVISVWLRRRKRSKKKHNRSMASRNNLVIQNDLQTIVTVNDETFSRDIKRNPTLQADIHQEMSAP